MPHLHSRDSSPLQLGTREFGTNNLDVPHSGNACAATPVLLRDVLPPWSTLSSTESFWKIHAPASVRQPHRDGASAHYCLHPPQSRPERDPSRPALRSLLW